MSSGFKFDASQPYQLDAIKSVVDLFDGQPKDAEKLGTTLRGQVAALDETENAALDLDLSQEVGAVGNRLVLDPTRRWPTALRGRVTIQSRRASQ